MVKKNKCKYFNLDDTSYLVIFDNYSDFPQEHYS